VGFGFLVLVSGFEMRGLGFRFRVPKNQHLRYVSEPSHEGFGLRLFAGVGFLVLVSGFEFRVSSFGFRVSGCGVRVPGSGFLQLGIPATLQNHLMKVSDRFPIEVRVLFG